MRRRTHPSYPTRRLPVLIALFVALATLVSCGSRVPPTVTLHPQMALDPDAAIYVTSNRQRERVMLAVQNAGLNVASEFRDARYSLRVKIGRSRGGGECGANANVVYILDAIGRRAMVIKGRGRTGDCEPNILDEMSAKLAMGFGL